MSESRRIFAKSRLTTVPRDAMMSSSSTHTRTHTHSLSLCHPTALSFALILSFTLPLKAQIIIRDTLVISSGQEVGPSGEADSPMVDSLFIAPRSGALAITPLWIEKLHNPLSVGHYLAIQLPDTTYAVPVLPYLPCVDIWQWVNADTCGVRREPYVTTYDYLWCGSSSPDTFYTKHVNEGDTVRFTFYGDYYNPTYAIVDFYPLWIVRMKTSPLCQANDDPSEYCEVWFSFADTLLKFTRPDSAVVYPTYPNHNDSTAKKNWIDLELRVEFADSAIPNYWVRVDPPILADSGGHSHDGTRPMGRYVYPITSTDTSDTGIVAQTDSEGKIRFRYVASQFGGVERMRARLLSDTTKFDTLSLITRVPGLDSLGTGTHYVLVGAPNNHSGTNDPCRTAPPTSLHYKNHYGTLTLRNAIDSIATRYNRLFPQIRLRINDMSLALGGGFDTGNGWAADIVDEYPSNTRRCNDRGHCSHREGRHADIGQRAINQSGDCVVLTTIDEDLRKLRDIIKDVTKNDSYIEGDHEHITANP